MKISAFILSLTSVLSFAADKLPACPVFWGLNKSADVVDEKTGEVAPKASIFIANDWDPANAGFDDLLFSKFDLFRDKNPDLNLVTLRLTFKVAASKDKIKESSSSFKVEYWDKAHSYIHVKELDLVKELAKFGNSIPKKGIVEILFKNQSLCLSEISTAGEGSSDAVKINEAPQQR
ncbi:MAG: hypothetical protein KA116_07380 [Proteobacteria bacterium]|nr:hypothetical protein [Pseudomonadota bacterium]